MATEIVYLIGGSRDGDQDVVESGVDYVEKPVYSRRPGEVPVCVNTEIYVRVPPIRFGSTVLRIQVFILNTLVSSHGSPEDALYAIMRESISLRSLRRTNHG